MRIMGIIAAALVGTIATLAPAQACTRPCTGLDMRDCTWRGACGPDVFARTMTSMRWQPRLPNEVVRVVTRMDVEALRLLQRMP